MTIIDIVSYRDPTKFIMYDRPKIYCVERRYLDFLLKNLFTYLFFERFDIWDLTLKYLGFEEKWGSDLRFG